MESQVHNAGPSGESGPTNRPMRSKVQGRIREAFRQVEEVRERVVETMAGSLRDKFRRELDSLRGHGHGLLRTISAESNRLAEDTAVPMPRVLRTTLGRVNTFVGQWTDQVPTQEQQHRDEMLNYAAAQVNDEAAASKSPRRGRRGGQAKSHPEGGSSHKRRRRAPRSDKTARSAD